LRTTRSASSRSCSTSTGSSGTTSPARSRSVDADGNAAGGFTPDFYLPAQDLYIEITTLNQKLVTRKNRKARRLREQYPDVRIKVLYQRDYLHLLVKYGLELPSQLRSDLGPGVPLCLDVDAPAEDAVPPGQQQSA